MQYSQLSHALSLSTQPRRTLQGAILARAFAARTRPQTLRIIASELAAYIPHDLAWALRIDTASGRGRLLWACPHHPALNLLPDPLPIDTNILHAVTKPPCGIYRGHRFTHTTYDRRLAACGIPAHVTIGLPAENEHHTLATFARQRPTKYHAGQLALLKHLLPAIATALLLPLPQPEPPGAAPGADPQTSNAQPPAASTARLFDLKPAVRNVVDCLRRALQPTEGPHTTNIEYAGSSALTIADPVDFSRALGVLAFNAATVAGPDGRVSLRTRPHPPRVELKIRLAPSPADLTNTPHPSTPFYMPRTEADTRFGLTIAAQMARRYSGSLLLRSNARHRLTITLSMPLAENAHTRAATLPHCHTQTGGRTK